MIIETTCNKLFFVVDFEDANLAHVWKGLRVKRSPLGFTVTAKKVELVRKGGSKIIDIDKEPV